MNVAEVSSAYVDLGKFWTYDPKSKSKESQFYDNAWIIGDKPIEGTKSLPAAYFYVKGEKDNVGFTPTSIDYDARSGLLSVQGRQEGVDRILQRAYMMNAPAPRFMRVRASERSRRPADLVVKNIIVDMEDSMPNIKAYLGIETEEKEVEDLSQDEDFFNMKGLDYDAEEFGAETFEAKGYRNPYAFRKPKLVDIDEYKGHTEGDWETNSEDSQGVWQEHDESIPRTIAMVHPTQNWEDMSEAEFNRMMADKKLIADAPMLLEEVKKGNRIKEYIYQFAQYPSIKKIHLDDLIAFIEEDDERFEADEDEESYLRHRYGESLENMSISRKLESVASSLKDLTSEDMLFTVINNLSTKQANQLINRLYAGIREGSIRTKPFRDNMRLGAEEDFEVVSVNVGYSIPPERREDGKWMSFGDVVFELSDGKISRISTFGSGDEKSEAREKLVERAKSYLMEEEGF